MDKIDSLLLQSAILFDRQYILVEHLIGSQAGVLERFEQALSNKDQHLGHVLDVYNYAFALIDHLVRFQKTARSIPKINQKSQEFKDLNESIAALKGVRNQIQHLNNEIENEYTGPLLGSISWASGNKTFVAAFHDLGRERSFPSLILDTHTGEYVQQFCYVYNGTYYDLGKAIFGMRAFYRSIKSKIKVQIDGEDYDPNKHFVALCMEVRKLGYDGA